MSGPNAARVLENVQTQSLTALGLKRNVFPFSIPRVIGPFNYFDARASYHARVVAIYVLMVE